MQNENLNLAKQFQTSLIIWGAILMSQLIFLLMLFLVKPELFKFDFSGPLWGEKPPITIAMLAAALFCFMGSFTIRSTLIKKAIATSKPLEVNTAVILGVAMCEAATLFGLVTAFVEDYLYFFIFFALGIVGILLHFPKRDDLMAAGFKPAGK